jgi:DNA-binding CsgD family transcriptional regulator
MPAPRFAAEELVCEFCGATPRHRPGCKATTGIGGLTAREKQVLAMLADGMTPKEIAAELGISRRTVEDHKYNAARQLGVDRPALMLRLWFEYELTTGTPNRQR